MQPAIDKGYNPDDFNRLLNVGWSSSLHNFIYTTVFSGRPNSSQLLAPPDARVVADARAVRCAIDQVEDLTAVHPQLGQGR